MHGGLSDHREWRPQLDGLSDTFTVVAWDAPGVGASSDPPQTFRMPDYATCLAGFVEALRLGRPNLLGLSWGSALALQVAALRPEIPRTLVLTAAYAGWSGSLSPDVVAQRLTDTLRDLETLSPVDHARALVPTLFTERAPLDVVENYVGVLSESRPSGARPMLRAIAEADLRDVLPAIRVPTLLLCGERDARSPLAVAQHLQASIPGSTLVVLPQAGHMGNLESPDAFNAAVRDFLDAHPLGGRGRFDG